MIKTFEVRNLNNKISEKFIFNSDLNIITGKNGCGKTTLLKLMWYFVSGSYNKIFDEMDFDYAQMVLGEDTVITMEVTGGNQNKETTISIESQSENINYKARSSKGQENAFTRRQSADRSLFFPTFRRIEGGFTITSNSIQRRETQRCTLREALAVVSENLTTSLDHQFIASISTEDVNSLLTNKYADISEQLRKAEAYQSNKIFDIIAKSQGKEKESLEEIRTMVDDNRARIKNILKPLSVLSNLVNKIFKDKSINISSDVGVGWAKEAISSDKLSAGEKQMLSFLCYNFFFDNSVIFIDEPELSLHTDWQRILFPTLLRQGKENQFIIATHSPFIYSKYPEKEIIITPDKGNQNGEKQ